MQAEFLVVVQRREDAEAEQAAVAHRQAGPGPDAAPDAFQDEVAEGRIHRRQRGLGACDMRLPEHRLADDHPGLGAAAGRAVTLSRWCRTARVTAWSCSKIRDMRGLGERSPARCRGWRRGSPRRRRAGSMASRSPTTIVVRASIFPARSAAEQSRSAAAQPSQPTGSVPSSIRFSPFEVASEWSSTQRPMVASATACDAAARRPGPCAPANWPRRRIPARCRRASGRARAPAPWRRSAGRSARRWRRRRHAPRRMPRLSSSPSASCASIAMV